MPGLGLGLGLAVPPPSSTGEAAPSLPNVFGWAGRSADAVMKAAPDDDEVASWPGLNGTGTATVIGTPTRASGRIICGASNYFALPSALAATGPFSLYAVINGRTTGTVWPLFAPTARYGAVVFSDARTYLQDDAGGNVGTPGGEGNLTGRGILRLRRNAADEAFVRITGGIETSLGTIAGTFTFARMLGAPSVSFWCDASVETEFMGLAHLIDTVAGGQDAGVLAFLAAEYGVAF